MNLSKEPLKKLCNAIKRRYNTMEISDAKYRANKKYDKKTYCQVTLMYRKDADLTLQMVNQFYLF